MITFNGNPVPTTLFPDNTSQVWKLNQEILETTNFAHIVWTYSNEGEFMQLAQLKMLLDRHGFKTCLRLPYLPYARQDKPVANDATFALFTFAKLLNSLNFDEVICMDPHSKAAGILIKNFTEKYPIRELSHVLDETTANLVCYPDEGALVKYSGQYTDLVGEKFIFGRKVRDQATGFIKHYEIVSKQNFDLKKHRVLMVDDICDGGATFQILAKGLLEAGAQEVNLFVSHGIFSKGLKPLFDSGIKRIFTIDGEAGEVQNNITYRRL